MTVIEIMQQLEKSKETLDKLTDELKRKGYILAAAEREYRKSLAIKEVELREKKYPGALVSDIAKGETSELRYKRDIAEIEQNVCQERLRNEKANLETLRSLLAWERANYINN